MDEDHTAAPALPGTPDSRGDRATSPAARRKEAREKARQDMLRDRQQFSEAADKRQREHELKRQQQVNQTLKQEDKFKEDEHHQQRARERRDRAESCTQAGGTKTLRNAARATQARQIVGAKEKAKTGRVFL